MHPVSIKVGAARRIRKDIDREKELYIADIEKSLQNWSIPIIKKSEVYKQHSIWSTNQDEIHIMEYGYRDARNNQTLNILKQGVSDQHIREGSSKT
ncbi:hypothetical protein CR513_55946, partial [Mucuna pruriens]